MRLGLLLYFSVIFTSAYCNDSIRINIYGKITDKLTHSAIKKAQLRTFVVYGNSNISQTFVTDTNGNYNLSFIIPKGNVSLIIEAFAEKYFSNSYYKKDTLMENTTTIECNFSLKESPSCVDTWLPPTIFFTKASCEISDSSKADLVTWLQFFNNNHIFYENRKLQITAYCSFDENVKIAKGRAESVRQFFIAHGLSDIEVKITIGEKKDLIHFYNVEGCFTKLQRETKLDLSKDFFKKQTDKKIKSDIDNLRRSVRFNWMSKNTR